MFRLAGVLLIISGFIGMGISYLDKQKKRLEFMEAWEYISGLYFSEIAYKKQLLSMASIEIGNKLDRGEGAVLKRIGEKTQKGEEGNFSQIWKREWSRELTHTCFAAKEKKMVLDFAAFTGYEDEEIQKNMLLVQQEKWKRMRMKAEDESKENKKLVLVLSSCMGVLTVLLLL